MAEHGPATLDELNQLIAASEPMVEGGTRAVLGEGPVGAAVAFVGEQPGDQEDLQGRPFVGPAGQLLDRAMAEAGIDRGETYVTNAVKHFKYVQRGKRRLHQRPTTGEVRHYQWWLKRELDFVAPARSSWRSAPPRCWRSPAGRCRSPPTAARPPSTTAADTLPCTRPTCSVCPTRRRRTPPTPRSAAISSGSAP